MSLPAHLSHWQPHAGERERHSPSKISLTTPQTSHTHLRRGDVQSGTIFITSPDCVTAATEGAASPHKMAVRSSPICHFRYRSSEGLYLLPRTNTPCPALQSPAPVIRRTRVCTALWWYKCTVKPCCALEKKALDLNPWKPTHCHTITVCGPRNGSVQEQNTDIEGPTQCLL